jgi:hypothetical protein
MAHSWHICFHSPPFAEVHAPPLNWENSSCRFVKIRPWGFRDAEVADANGAFARRLPTPPLPPPCGDFATHSAVGRSGLRAVLERAAR